MNRREFLRAGFGATVGLAALTVMPSTVFASDKSAKLVPFKFAEEVTWHRDRAAFFYVAQTEICGIEYCCGEFIEKDDDVSMRTAREVAKGQFKKKARRLSFL